MIWLNIFILVLAIPVGYFIAYLAREELVQGRFWFKILIILSFVGAIGSWVYGFSVLAWTFGFILILALVALRQSFVKGFVKRKV